MSDFLVPDEITESIGWRGWRIHRGRLSAINDPESFWDPGEALHAKCGRGARHPVPFAKCSCGFYATKSLEKLISNGYHTDGAFGTVSLWGKMVEADQGYRAQFAYPREIWVPYTNLPAIEELAVYGVPVRLANPYTLSSEEALRDGYRQRAA